MKYLFRFQRGSLQDSMRTTRLVRDVEDIRTILLENGFKDGNIEVEPYAADYRVVGWERTYLVTLDGNGVGFVNGAS